MKLFTEESAIKILEEFTQDVKDIGKKINERFVPGSSLFADCFLETNRGESPTNISCLKTSLHESICKKIVHIVATSD